MNTPRPTTDAVLCEHCGRPRELVSLPAFGTLDAVSFPAPCDCEGAKAERARLEAEERERREREERERLQRRYERAGIPRRYWEAETDDPRLGSWLETIRKGGGLYFTGKQGRGKTHAACAILRRFIAEGWQVRFADVETIEREVTSAWRSRETTEARVIDRYLNARLVVIDDLGAETLTAVTMKALRAVISGREANMAPTIFTSNFDRLAFAKHIAEAADQTQAARLASRIKGMTEVAEFTGADRRLG